MSVHTAVHQLAALNKRADALGLDETLEVTLAELDLIRHLQGQTTHYRGRGVKLISTPDVPPGTDPA